MLSCSHVCTVRSRVYSHAHVHLSAFAPSLCPLEISAPRGTRGSAAPSPGPFPTEGLGAELVRTQRAPGLSHVLGCCGYSYTLTGKQPRAAKLAVSSRSLLTHCSDDRVSSVHLLVYRIAQAGANVAGSRWEKGRRWGGAPPAPEDVSHRFTVHATVLRRKGGWDGPFLPREPRALLKYCHWQSCP